LTDRQKGPFSGLNGTAYDVLVWPIMVRLTGDGISFFLRQSLIDPDFKSASAEILRLEDEIHRWSGYFDFPEINIPHIRLDPKNVTLFSLSAMWWASPWSMQSFWKIGHYATITFDYASGPGARVSRWKPIKCR